MPNELPLNWCECTLGDIATYINGLAFKPSDWENNGLPIIRIQNLTNPNKEFNYTTKNFSQEYHITSGDILLSWSATLDVFIWKKSEALLNQHIFKVIPDKLLNKSFVFYLLKNTLFSLIYSEYLHGSTMKHINRGPFLRQKILLPPLAEQERIVEKIEALFTDIDEGVERLKSAQAQIKQYRQSVLKSAFCFQNNYFCYLKDCIEKPRYGTSKKCSIDLKNSTPVYRIPNINFLKGIIDKSELKYAVFDDTEKKSLSLQKGDILLIRSNGSLNLVGRAALIHDNDINGLFAGYLIRIRVADYTILNPEFLLYYLNSPKARTYIEEKAKSTSGVNNINSEEISELEIPLPSISEQQRIVEEIEKRFAVADELKKAVNDGLEKAEKLKQSILKKAFEGKLVAQNPNDEPASVLLDRIKKETQSPTKGKKK